jgi:two-component system, chemotaxis family, protein-glutamate methylesterase/glutaminase
MDHDLVVIGASWGGLHAIGALLEQLGDAHTAAVVVAQHRGSGSELLAPLLQRRTPLPVREAEDKERLEAGTVYIAPTDYHTLVEAGGTIALSTEAVVHHARPSIDVLFRSAAEAYREHCVGVVLTGANEDGAEGLVRIVELGGVAVVQDPRTADRREMPAAALAATNVDAVLPLAEIGTFLRRLVLGTPSGKGARQTSPSARGAG